MNHNTLRGRVWARPYTFAIIVLLLLAGCTLGSEPAVIIVTATPLPGPTATATLPPTPTVPPTATPDPAVALQLADQYLTNGYYEKAVAVYQSILTAGFVGDMGAAAAFGLGRAALREGLFSDSTVALTQFISQYPNDGRAAQAYFLRGDAYMGESNWAAALADFQQYLALRPALIDSYVRERIGDAQLALGQASGALDSYAGAAEAGRSLVPLLALREKVAQVYLTNGQVAPALAQYDAILGVAQKPAYRASIEYAAATTALNGGLKEEANARFLAIVERYPEYAEAYQAMQSLLEAEQVVDDYTIGTISYNYGDYQRAVEAFNNYSSGHVLADVPADMYLLLGRAYRELGNPSAAITAFQTVVNQYPNDALFGTALLEQGRTRFLAGDIDGAITHYLNMAKNYSYLPEAAEALWRAGYLYGTNDKSSESRAVFEDLANTFPNSEQASSGLFLAASAAYNLGDTAGAERLYAKLAVNSTGEDQAAAYLWVGRLAMARGDNSIGADALRLAVSAAPDSYFGARAGDILAGRDSFARPVGYAFSFDNAAQLAEAEAWLRAKFAITQAGDLWRLSPTLQSDARLIRGNELWAVGAYNEAEVEFDDALSAYSADGLASYQLAIFLRGLGAYSPAIQGAANVIKAAGASTLDAPAYLARMRYPTYYLDVVLDAAQRHNLDPLLLFSLIRHESLFDTYAVAGAGEKGLTQVIPSTGEYIAQQLNWPNYQHSDLFRPYAGIEFGAYFLSENLASFDGNVQAALAGYNAGPGRAAQWLELSGGDPDQFMTAITIDSTRGYVQRIYGYYNVYRTLYGR